MAVYLGGEGLRSLLERPGLHGEGMQIVGGCCGVRPAHIAALKAALAGQAAGPAEPA